MTKGERRVVITGLGVISAIGHSVDAFWQTIEAGGCGIAPITSVDTSRLSFTMGAEVRDFDAEASLSKADAHQMDRFAQFAMVAAREAATDSGIDLDTLASPRSGVVLGTSAAGQATLDASFKSLYGDDNHRLHPLTVPRYMPNAAASHISMHFGLMGPSYTMCTACSSSNHAIGNAFWLIRSGILDAAFTGGSDAQFNLGNLSAWSSMRVVSPDVCRPFAAGRNGMILGEGGGILLLEEAESARARGAKIYGEIVGFGMSADAHHLVKPLPNGAALAISSALADGGVTADMVSYVNAHGTGTPLNDKEETKTIRLGLGSAAEKVAVSSTKSSHGHGLGVAGALEAVATAMAVHKGVLPPTVNFDEPDPECDLDVVANEPREATVDVALSNSFAFGGLNAVIAFRRYS
jgi:nodulation protein E